MRAVRRQARRRRTTHAAASYIATASTRYSVNSISWNVRNRLGGYAAPVLESAHGPSIAKWFSLGDDATLTGPVARGELGQVWRLMTSGGVWAVKEPFEPKSETDAREEADIQELALASGVLTPRVVRSADGGVSMDIGASRVTVCEWVDLKDRNRYLEPTAVGGLIASLHRIPFPELRPEDPWYREPITGERWDELVRHLSAARAPFAGALASYRDELVALGDLVEPPTALRTCHRDLWADNVRATVAGGICVFDWENFGLADPSQELALVLFEFGAGDARRIRTIHDAYANAGGPGHVTERATFSMLIAQLGHIGEAGCRQWLGHPDSSAEREHAAAWVGEFLGEPLSRDAIDAILDAVR
jgi:aminoglycoside phosphotransferase (APT) family kinase protein